MEGMYKILSAITNPTGKKMLEAGMKGRIIHAAENKTCLEYVSVDDINVSIRKNKSVTIAIIAKVLGSVADCSRGMDPIVQSQQSCKGQRRSQILRHGR